MAADLHSRIATEIDRRLAVARAAAGGKVGESWTADGVQVLAGDILLIQPNTWFGPAAVAAHIALNDPADSIRRLEAASRVLNRHADHEGRCVACMEWCQCPDEAPVRDCACRGNLPHPCPELLDLAASLGLDTEGSTRDGQ